MLTISANKGFILLPVIVISTALSLIGIGILVYRSQYKSCTGGIIMCNRQLSTPKPMLTVSPTPALGQGKIQESESKAPTSKEQDITQESSSSGLIRYHNKTFGYAITLPNNWRINSPQPAGILSDGIYSGFVSFTNKDTATNLRIITNLQGDWSYGKQEKLKTKSGLDLEKYTSTEADAVYYLVTYIKDGQNIFISIRHPKPTDRIDEIVQSLVLD